MIVKPPLDSDVLISPPTKEPVVSVLNSRNLAINFFYLTWSGLPLPSQASVEKV